MYLRSTIVLLDFASTVFACLYYGQANSASSQQFLSFPLFPFPSLPFPPSYVVGLVFGAEHVILLAALFLQWAIASVPKRVSIAIARREFLAQKRMAREAGTATAAKHGKKED